MAEASFSTPLGRVALIFVNLSPRYVFSIASAVFASLSNTNTHTQTDRERERERERGKGRDRQTDRQRDCTVIIKPPLAIARAA